MTDEEWALWRAALDAFEEQQSGTQEVLCQAFLARQPGNMPALALRLHALTALKRFADCEDLILQVGPLTESKERSVWGRALGDYLSICGRHEEAERAFRDAQNASVDVPPEIFINHISESLMSQGKLEQALLEIDSFLVGAVRAELNVDDHAEMLENRVFVLRGLGRFEDALATLESLSELDPAFERRNVKMRKDLEKAIEAQARWWDS